MHFGLGLFKNCGQCPPVRTNKRLLMLEHQERLTTLYSTDEVESQNREIDETVASKREAIWMLSNQIDALNLESF